jgi:hypothetical protein cdivTM_08298
VKRFDASSARRYNKKVVFITTKFKKNYLFFSFEKLTIEKQKKEVKNMATKNTKKNSENEAEKTQKSASTEKNLSVENDVSKTQKIRSYRDLKLKALKREKLEEWELKKIADRIVFLKDEKEKLKEQKKAVTEELEELKIILKTYKNFTKI